MLLRRRVTDDSEEFKAGRILWTVSASLPFVTDPREPIWRSVGAPDYRYSNRTCFENYNTCVLQSHIFKRLLQ